MCCTRLAENTGRKNDAKNRHLRTIAQLCRAISSHLRHVSIMGKKAVKQQYPLHMSLRYGELRPTSGWDRFGCLGYSSEFQLVSRPGFVTAATSLTTGQPNFAALNRGRHQYSAGRPSRWTLAHILVDIIFEICACNIRFNGVTQSITANVRVLNDGIEMRILLILFYILLLLTQTRKPAAIAGLNRVSSDRAKPGYSI